MRTLTKRPSDSDFLNVEAALNELLRGGAGLSTATLSQVDDTDSSTTLLAANSERKGCIIFNNSPAILYVALSSTATTSAFSYRLVPNATLELFAEKNYVGLISGIWASNSSGRAVITELED